MSTSGAAALSALLETIEEVLAEYYALQLDVHAQEYLVTPASESQDNRLVVFQADSETLELGIQLQPALIDCITQHNPLDAVSNLNLDAFWVIVEELSHFHLLTQRAHDDRSCSVLELEWQGEIDKIIVASHLLQKQTGSAHFRELLVKAFGEAHFVSENPVYAEANKFAWKFWQEFINRGMRSPHEREHLSVIRDNYRAPMEEKFPFTRRLRAS